MDFKPFPKLARLNREIIITEKLDGTNAQVYITTPFDREQALLRDDNALQYHIAYQGELGIMAGSRTKWITPGKTTDNYGFAQWVKDNAEELFQLGPGQHFGEWWGGKIQRGYQVGLVPPQKRFSLFNTSRWVTQVQWATEGLRGPLGEGQQYAPACCHVVPVLHQGRFNTEAIEAVLNSLRLYGSVAAPGFMRPEGIVIYHTAGNTMWKVTLENDEIPKGLVRAA